jgi:hypothetical protein
MDHVLSNAKDAAAGLAHRVLLRLGPLLDGVSDGGADSGVLTLDWARLARGWPAVARGLVAHADRFEVGAAVALALWYRSQWRALARGLALVAAARLVRVYARAVGSGQDHLSCAVRVCGGYSLARMLVRVKGQCELRVPVVGRFRLECAFDSIDDAEAGSAVAGSAVAAAAVAAAAVAEQKEREEVDVAVKEEEEEVDNDGNGNEHVLGTCNAEEDDTVVPQNTAIMLPLEDKEAFVVASSEKPDRADLFYSAKKPRQRSSMSSRRQTCNVNDLQALLQEFGQSPVGESIVVSDIDEEMEAGEEDEGTALILLSPCNDNNKENDNTTMMMASSARTPTKNVSPISQQLWTPRTTAAGMIAKSSAVVSTVDEFISGAIAAKHDDTAMMKKSSKHSKKKRRRRRGGDSFIYRPSSIGTSSSLLE